MKYINITVLGEDNQFLLEKIMKVVHGFSNAKKNQNITNQLAVGFPDWTQGKERADIGFAVRIFSTEEILNEFLKQKPILALSRHKEILVSNPEEIPPDTLYVRFSRDRRMEKLTPIQKKKRLLNSSQPMKNPVPIDKSNLYYFKMKSESTNQENFSLFITKNKANGLATQFSSYGLSTQIDLGVPHF